MRTLEGVVAATVTPLTPGGSLDLPSFRRHLADLLDAGIDGVFVGGTTGEGMLLNTAERLELVRVALEVAGGRIPVVGHCSCFTTQDTVELGRHMGESGADGVAVLPPLFYRVDEEAMVNHFGRVAAEVSSPVYLYSIPDNVGVDIPPGVVRRMRESLAGIKYSGCNPKMVREYVECEVPVLIGCDARILSALWLRVAGVISGTAACFPRLFVELFRRVREGTGAEDVQALITRVDAELSALPPVASYKAVLRRRGVIESATVRRPLRELRPDEEMMIDQLVGEVQG